LPRERTIDRICPHSRPSRERQRSTASDGKLFFASRRWKGVPLLRPAAIARSAIVALASIAVDKSVEPRPTYPGHEDAKDDGAKSRITFNSGQSRVGLISCA